MPLSFEGIRDPEEASAVLEGHESEHARVRVGDSIESFNGLWQTKVWQRFQFDDLQPLIAHSGHYI